MLLGLLRAALDSLQGLSGAAKDAVIACPPQTLQAQRASLEEPPRPETASLLEGTVSPGHPASTPVVSALPESLRVAPSSFRSLAISHARKMRQPRVECHCSHACASEGTGQRSALVKTEQEL